jgi:hypothetical protein
MARDKRGQTPEPTIADDLEDLSVVHSPETAIHNPTSRNEIGNTKRAAEKATGVMGASKKVDPDLKIPAPQTDGLKKSRAADRAVRPLDKGHLKRDLHTAEPENVRHTRSNAEIAESVTTTAKRSPAPRSAQTDAPTGFYDPPEKFHARTGSSRQRVPAPGNAVSVTKGRLVRGHATASQAGGRSQSSTGDNKPPKRSARAGVIGHRPLSKGGREERHREKE